MLVEPVPGVTLADAPAVQDYLAGAGPVWERFDLHPYRQESYAARRRYLAERWDAPGAAARAELARVLTDYSRQIGAGADALENAALLGQPGTLAVVTGQQAGAVTGPLYTLYKAITAIHLARAQSRALGVPVVPVFWVAGEDHDFAEISPVHLPDRDGWTRLQLGGEPQGRVSVGHIPVGPAVDELLEQLAAALPETEFRAGIMEGLARAAAGAENLADWFAAVLAHLLRGTGLVFVSSALGPLRRMQGEFFARAAARHGAVAGALAGALADWERLGYAPTVDPQPGSLHLFMYLDGQRTPLAVDGDRVRPRDAAGPGWSLAELADLARAHPEQFSTNVVLRPACQGCVLPDLAYVGGPGEIQYFGLYREVFQALGQEMPIVYPRTSVTLVEPPIARHLDKQGLALPDALLRMPEVREQVLADADAVGLEPLFGRFRADVGARYDQLVQTLLEWEPSLRPITDENRRQLFRQVEILQGKAAQAHRKQNEVALSRLDRIAANLRPFGNLQERVANVTYYLCKYGPDLVQRLVSELPLPSPWTHLAVRL